MSSSAIVIPEWIGWVGVLVAIVFWGSFGVFTKLKTVRDANVNPVFFQLYMSVAVFLSGFVVLAWSPWTFGWYGIVGGSLWAVGQLLAIVSIRLLGLGIT